MLTRTPAAPLDYANPNHPKFAAPGFFSLPASHRIVLEASICLLPCVMIGGQPQPVVSTLVLCLTFCVLLYCRNQRRRNFPAVDLTGRRYWQATTWLVVSMLILSIQFDRCPHAMYLMLGPFEASTAPPCNNGRRYRNVFTWLAFPRS